MSAVNKRLAELRITLTAPKSSKNERHFTDKNAYLVPYFNFLFYIAFFPFKLEFDEVKNKYVEETSRFQRVLCALSNTAILSFMTCCTTLSLVYIMGSDPTKSIMSLNIFDVANSFGLLTTSAFTVHMAWRRKDLLLAVIEKTRVSFVSSKKLRFIGALVFCCCILLLILIGATNCLLITHYANLVHEYELSENFSENGTPSSVGNGNPWQIFANVNRNNNSSGHVDYICTRVVKILLLLSYVYLSTFYTIVQIAFLVLALTLRQVGGEFRKKLKAEGYLDDGGLQQGLSLYKQMKELTESVKTVFGNALICYYISAVAYLAEAPYIMLGYRSDLERVIMIYSTLSLVVWILAAEFHHSVGNDVAKWTDYHFNRADLSTDNRLILLKIVGEISSNETTIIALSTKCFSVTYKHLGSMLSLIVTYGIIIFQLHHGQFAIDSQ